MRFTRIVKSKIPLDDFVVIEIQQQPKKNAALPMLVGLMALLLGLTLSTETWADCGGYVNIGNKSKLRELQKEGFTFGLSMESHEPQPQHSHLRNPSSRISKLDAGHGKTADERKSRPVPCSGPNCGANRIPASQPAKVAVELLSLKPLKTSVASYEKFSIDSYFCRSEYSEIPVLYKLLIDRPPE